MSVLAHSPFSSGKRRIFEDDDTTPDKHLKRARCLGAGSPWGRCVPAPPGAAPAFDQGGVHPSTFAALCALFPHMDEQTVSNVLAECGNDIDAAIRRLTDLKLGGASATVSAGGAQAAAGKDQGPGAVQALAAAAHQQLKQQQHKQQQAAPAAAAPEPPAPAAGPQTAEQWTDALVQEMAAARDMQDAKQRGAKMLQAFEAFVSSRASKAGAGSDDSAGGGASSSAPQQQRLDEALRENVILKRAVAIQNARMQEAVALRDAEIAKLNGALAAEQEARKALERSNYSLSVHLQMATGAGGGGMTPPGHRPPDVY